MCVKCVCVYIYMCVCVCARARTTGVRTYFRGCVKTEQVISHLAYFHDLTGIMYVVVVIA